MIPYGKTAGNAIAAMSYLAEGYGGELRKISSQEIALGRNLTKGLVAKILTQLSQAGLVDGSPGPGGGYYLSRAPAEITLWDVVRPFERLDRPMSCPFGPNWCGVKEPCPLHGKLVTLNGQAMAFLKSNTLAIFGKSPMREEAGG